MLTVRQTASGEEHAAERVHVVDGRHESAAGGRERGRRRPLTGGRVEHDRRSGQGIALVRRPHPGDVGRRERGVAHAERLEHPLPEHGLERLTGGARDQHTEHVGAVVVGPPLPRLVEQRQRREPADPLVGLGRDLGIRRRGGDAERIDRLHEWLRERRGEVHADAGAERQDVVEGDRPLRGHGVPVDRPLGVDQHPTIGELGYQCIDRVVEAQCVVLHQHQRRDRGDRLRDRRDAEHAVALDGGGFATRERAGCTRVHLLTARRQPRHTPDVVGFHVPGDRLADP